MNDTPIKQDAVSEQRIGDELYIYGAGGETLTVLNTVAMCIWSLCDGTHTEAEMLELLHELYPDIETGSLREDIAHCLHEFRDNGLTR